MKYNLGRQPLISVYADTGRGIDIIFSMNIQQECIHSLIVVEKGILSTKSQCVKVERKGMNSDEIWKYFE
jgi:hypothetical protein